MITFNLQAGNGNYYRGHRPCNESSNCWIGEEKHALCMTLEQARAIATAWRGFIKIVIALSAAHITDKDFKRELFCASGGNWYDWDGDK